MSMNNNLEFIREVSAYFMDLQSNLSLTDSKRYIRNKNDKNMKIGVSITSKYDRFDYSIKKLIAEKMNDSSLYVKGCLHTKTKQRNTETF